MKFIDNFITNWIVNSAKLKKSPHPGSIGSIIILLEIICTLACIILLKNSIWIIPGMFVIIITFFILCAFSSYDDSLDCIRKNLDYTLMPFDSWKDIYSLNPDSWEWGKIGYDIHQYIKGIRTKNLKLEYKSFQGYIVYNECYKYDYYYIYFSFLDYFKFKKFSKKVDKQKELLKEQNISIRAAKKETDTLKSILNKAQNEIDELKKQSCDELNKGCDTVKSVSENLTKNNCEQVHRILTFYS